MTIERDTTFLGKTVWVQTVEPSEEVKKYRTGGGQEAKVWVVTPEQIQVTVGKIEYKLRRFQIDSFKHINFRSWIPGVTYKFRYERRRSNFKERVKYLTGKDK